MHALLRLSLDILLAANPGTIPTHRLTVRQIAGVPLFMRPTARLDSRERDALAST
jgi:hypothetical protein